jgi:hypothetical protein
MLRAPLERLHRSIARDRDRRLPLDRIAEQPRDVRFSGFGRAQIEVAKLEAHDLAFGDSVHCGMFEQGIVAKARVDFEHRTFRYVFHVPARRSAIDLRRLMIRERVFGCRVLAPMTLINQRSSVERHRGCDFFHSRRISRVI